MLPGMIGYVLGVLITALKLETQSWAGRANLMFTLLSVVALITYFLSSTVSAVARIIATYWSAQMIEQSGDTVGSLFASLAGNFFACLILVSILDAVARVYNDYRSDKKEGSESE